VLAGGDDGGLGGLDLDTLALDALKDMERRPYCRGRGLSEGLSAGNSVDLVDLMVGGGRGSVGLGEDRAFVAPQSISISSRPKPMSSDNG